MISYPIAMKFCTEHGSITAVPCAKFPEVMADLKNEDSLKQWRRKPDLLQSSPDSVGIEWRLIDILR